MVLVAAGVLLPGLQIRGEIAFLEVVVVLEVEEVVYREGATQDIDGVDIDRLDIRQRLEGGREKGGQIRDELYGRRSVGLSEGKDVVGGQGLSPAIPARPSSSRRSSPSACAGRWARRSPTTA